MHEHEARLERLLAERVEARGRVGSWKLPGGALAGGGPAWSGEIVIRVEDPGRWLPAGTRRHSSGRQPI